MAFSEPLVSGIKLEDPEMADELRVARVGEYNFVQRSADQDRYNRLLGPVFQPEHRDKIRSYIHSMLRSDFNKRSKVRPMTTVASKVIP